MHPTAMERPRSSLSPWQPAVRPHGGPSAPWGTQTLDAHMDVVLTLCKIKLIPGFACIIKAVIKTMRCSKPFHQTIKTQGCLSPALQRKPPWEPLQPPSILLGRGPRSLSSYKVYSTASAQVEEQIKSLLKMLRAAITYLPSRTQTLPAPGRQKGGPGGHAARECLSAWPPFCLRARLLSHRLRPNAGRAGRWLWSELALAARTGRAEISELLPWPRGQLKATPKKFTHKFPPRPKKGAMRINELRA